MDAVATDLDYYLHPRIYAIDYNKNARGKFVPLLTKVGSGHVGAIGYVCLDFAMFRRRTSSEVGDANFNSFHRKDISQNMRIFEPYWLF